MSHGQPHQAHGGGYVPQGTQPAGSSAAHGGGYVPQGTQQGHQQQTVGSSAPHGGEYVPQAAQQGQQQTGSGDPHGGGYVPGQHWQTYPNRNFDGGYAPNQYPQGQGQGNWQVRENVRSKIEHIFNDSSTGHCVRARTEHWRFGDWRVDNKGIIFGI